MAQQVAILGFGTEGESAYRYFKAKGAQITIHDQNSELKLPPGAKGVLGEEYLDDLSHYDLVVRSPGVLPHLFETSAPVTSVVNEFMKECPAKIIGVTGTKGKGTTATLIHHLLKQFGVEAFLGGNIGTPPLDFLADVTSDDLVVLELSNVQLWDVQYSPHVAVVLKITPEHLDWHRGSMSEYVATKSNITAFQLEMDCAVYCAENRYAKDIAELSPGQHLAFFTDKTPEEEQQNGLSCIWVEAEEIKFQDQLVATTEDVKLPGRHNLQNVCAAIGAVLTALEISEVTAETRQKISVGLQGFAGLEHRLQLVREVGGVKYYNDSIGTTPETAIAAIDSFSEPKVLILGGSDKGLAFKELAAKVAQSQVKHVVTIGETAAAIEEELVAAGYPLAQITAKAEDMKTAVEAAASAAQAGDVVLLSPACASFGMFQDYKDRGEQFKEALKQLKPKDA